MNISEVISAFLLEQKARGNSEQTILYYRRSLGYFLDWYGDKDILELSRDDCKLYYVHLRQTGLTSVSQQSYVRALRAFLSWAYDEDYIDVDIPERFRLPKAQRKTIDILTESEADKLLCSFGDDYLGCRNWLICALMLDSGLRLGEVVALKLSDVHLDAVYLLVNGKGNKQRFVPLGAEVEYRLSLFISAFRLGLPGCDSLFMTADGKPLIHSTVKDLFRDLKISTGISRLHPHLLRHTFATRYLERGGDIYSLQIILGHTSLEMVKKYLHISTRCVSDSFQKYSFIDNKKPP